LNHPRINRRLRSVLLLSILVVSAAQLFIVVDGYSLVWAKLIYRTMTLPSMERNAIFLLGGKGAGFMKAISAAVPLDRPVVVPEGYGPFSEQSILQFFLMPRAVLACGCRDALEEAVASSECQACLLQEWNSVPAVGKFPPVGILDSSKRFLPYEEAGFYRGVYVPMDDPATDHPIFVRMTTPLVSAVFLDLLAVALVGTLGILVALKVDDDLGMAEGMTLSIPLGAGILTYVVFLLSWAGVRITLGLFAVVLLGGVALLWVTRGPRLKLKHRLHGWRLDAGRSLQGSPRRGVVVVLVSALAMLAASSVVISVGRGYSLFDGIANWALKGYGIAHEGTVFAGLRWGGHSLSYPMNIHLQIALFRLLDGDVLPGSKLLFPLYAICMFGGCYLFFRRSSVETASALIGVLLISTVPFLFMHTTLGWGNLILASNVVLSVLCLTTGYAEGNPRRAFLGGMLLALAIWTRPEGVAYAAVVAAIFLLAPVADGKMKPFWLIPSVIVAGTWAVFSYASISRDEIGVALSAFVRGEAGGEPGLTRLWDLARYAAAEWGRFEIWGWSFILMFPLLLIGSARGSLRRNRRAMAVGGAGVAALLLPLAMFYVASFSKGNMETFLWASFNRAQFSGAILLLCGLLVGALAPSRPGPSGGTSG
jgi:hypothetical protein